MIVTDKEYKVLGVRWYAKGLFVKHIKKGSEIQANYIYKVNKGDFIYSRLFAWKGSFAIATEEFDGCYVSNEFPCFLVKNDQISIEYLMWYFNQEHVWDGCLENSEGSTAISRNRLKVDKFLNIEIPLPTFEKQEEVVTKLNNVNSGIMNIMGLKEDSDKQISHLRESILQQAIKGDLVPQDPNDEPASVLLERIEAEKGQLIKEKNIKKEKPLPTITEDEIPYELPQGWKWVRLGELGANQGGATPSKSNPHYWEGEIPWISPKDMKQKYLINSIDKISADALSNTSSLKLISTNSLLFVVRGMILAHSFPVSVNRVQLCINQDMKSLTPHFKEISEFVYVVLKGRKNAILQLVEKSTHGTCRLNTELLFNLLVPLPPLNEQRRIVEKVDQLMALCDNLEKTVEQSKLDSEMLMQSVIQEAFSQSVKELNVVEFPKANSNDIEDWEIAARSDGEINSETKIKIKNRVTELLGKSQQ
ncbi:restriction endonuclease subunit S [Paenibacillus sp. MER 78]|nr:restriction endonuclease subunit S [Paenibacillus sp. MER 78]